ncbi:MAG: glycosyltransferase [Pyrinomonadaceae bacterium]
MKNELSIVIIGRNEQASIGMCIEAARAAAEEIGGADLLYVDSHSTDNTVAEGQRYGIAVKMLDRDLRPSPSAARHFGSRQTNNEYILFLDADTLIYTGFLKTALEQLRSDAQLGGINGRIYDTTAAGEPVDGVDEVCEEAQNVKWLRGPCCLYRRAALVEVGSFDPELATEEEAELGLRLIGAGWRLRTAPVPMAHHTRCYHPTSFRALVTTFLRDLRSGRLGEITRTCLHARRAGNGLEFCWLRLKTTILFLGWLFAIGAAVLFLPLDLRPEIVTPSLVIIGFIAVTAKKRSFSEALLFVPAKVLNLVDLILGIRKIGPFVESRLLKSQR